MDVTEALIHWVFAYSTFQSSEITIFASQHSYLIHKFSGVPTYLLRDVKGKKGWKTCTLFGGAMFSTVNTVAKLHIVHYWGSDITTIYIKPSYYAERLTHQLQSDEVLWF